jgi:hypothetical protein
MATKALAVQIILPEGDPDDLKFIQVTGWDEEAIVIPRTRLRAIKNDERISVPSH